MNIDIQWIVPANLPDVIRIEADSFEFPWSEGNFRQCLRERNTAGMVATIDSRVVGYMIYVLLPSSIELINFCVDRPFRRHGIGTQMCRYLIDKLSSRRRSRIVTLVREVNVAAKHFFAACGFQATSVERNPYEDTHDDGYLFSYFHEQSIDELCDRLFSPNEAG